MAGTLEKVSCGGRVRLREGEMPVRPTLDCHSNFTSRAQALRLFWPAVEGLGGVYRLDDLDAVVRAAERDADQASAPAQASVVRQMQARAGAQDWPDHLAQDLAGGSVRLLRAWARRDGLERETVSRGLARAGGVGLAPVARELKARAAWLRIARTRASLAAIAAGMGFSDQAPMPRGVKALTDAPPGAWREQP